METFTLAMSRFKRNKYDDCIILCDHLISKNTDDLAAQILKTNAIRRKNYIDDLEIDDEGLGDKLLDDHKISNQPRPGTSLQRPGTSSINQGIRPMSSSGRPITGVVRPNSRAQNSGLVSRGSTGLNNKGTSSMNSSGSFNRAITSGGRNVRLATASLNSINSSISLNVSNINSKVLVKKKYLAKTVIDFLYYVENDFKKCLEICTEGTTYYNYQDWWYKYKLGKVYNRLGMLSDSEKQLQSSLKHYKFVNTVLQLSQIYIKMDQPIKSLDILNKASEENPYEIYYELYKARLHEMIYNYDISISLYKKILDIDSCNFESIACIGANYFYSDNPEVALKYYKRLFELGINSVEVWNNLGLCAFYAGQYDFCLSCFERALLLYSNFNCSSNNENASNDEIVADIWYNISHVAIGLGDLSFAYQSLKVSLQYNNHHFEAQNNLGVLELKKGNKKDACSNFKLSMKQTEYSFEPHYNYAISNYYFGKLEDALISVKKALIIYPTHFDSIELQQTINKELIA